MRHLDRARIAAPACLDRFRSNQKTWNDLAWANRDEIRTQLGVLQNSHCAYCECDLQRETSKPHIDHFEQKSRYPKKTFDWNNLFWSCSHEDTCAKHKDHIVGTYKQPGILLKPDEDHPRRYLFFSSDGRAHPRVGLSIDDTHRALETIRVLALNDMRLVQMRRAYCAEPIGLMTNIADSLSLEEAVMIVDELAADYERRPFSSAMLDSLGVPG